MDRTRALIGTTAAGLLAIASVAGPTIGASHREAPLIAFDPSADITDLYAFVSPNAPNTVTFIADFSGFQEPSGGPNFYPFNPDVLYWIKVDNTGDGVEDLTWTFDFETSVANPDSFLYSGYGPIGAVDANVTQSYSVAQNGETIAEGLAVPPPNIGPRTTPEYGDLARAGVHELGDGGQVFAGQVDDPFFVDLGAIFDLGGLRPFNEAHLIPLDSKRGQDDLAGFNVNAIAVQLPIASVTNDGEPVTAADAPNAVIGVWAGASRMAPSMDGSGEWVQVSRLGNPLINEVIIPVGKKDAWNAHGPAEDGQYLANYQSPELAAIVNTIYPSLPDTRTTERDDLVLILGRGIPGVNQTNADGLMDMLRLNLGIAPAQKADRMAAVAGDVAGFPNGRRLTDDVVDIELRAVADGYGAFLAEAFGLPDLEPNNAVGDGCDANDVRFTKSFPYLGQAHEGYRGGEYRVRCKG